MSHRTVSFLEVVATREQEETAPRLGWVKSPARDLLPCVCACLCPQSHQLQRELVAAPGQECGLYCMWLSAVFVFIYPVLLCAHTHPLCPCISTRVHVCACCVLFILCLPIIPSALSSCNCLCMKSSTPQRTFSLFLFFPYKMR